MAAASASASHPDSMIANLQRARFIVLEDPAHFSQIIPGVIGIIGPSATLSLRRWGASFLAEALSYPKLDSAQRQTLALTILPTLKDYLDDSNQDPEVTKFAIMTATTVYPVAFKHIIYNPNESTTWDQLQAIRSSIVQRMDTSSTDVRVCCYKFVIRVVQTQTMGTIADPRRPELNEPSLALVPPNHPLLIKENIRPLTQGLFDRVLGIFQETTHNAFLVDATLMSIGSLGDTRSELLEKVIKVILTFNPFDNAEFPMSPRERVLLISMYRTLRAFLTSFSKRHDKHPMVGAVHHHLHALEESRKRTFDPNLRKRGGSSLPPDQMEPQKRQRSEEKTPGPAPSQPQTVSLANVWTLTDNPILRNFDARAKRPDGSDLVSYKDAWNVVLTTLANVNQNTFDNSINAVRERWLQLTQQTNTFVAPTAQTATNATTMAAPPQTATTTTTTTSQDYDDDDEEYEPEDVSQVLTRADKGVEEKEEPVQPPVVTSKPYVLPKAQPMTPQEFFEFSCRSHDRMFALALSLPDVPKNRPPRRFGERIRLEYRKDWLVFICRLINRPRLGLEPPIDPETGEDQWPNRRGDDIRERMVAFTLEDFRARMDFCTDWLCEEHLCDRLRQQKMGDEGTAVKNQPKWVNRVFDGFSTFLDGTRDVKFFTIFLSEIWNIDDALLGKVVKLADDPERVNMVVYCLHYLAQWREPVRERMLDQLEHLYRNNPHAKSRAAKALKALWRFRTPAIEEQAPTKESPTAESSTTQATA